MWFSATKWIRKQRKEKGAPTQARNLIGGGVGKGELVLVEFLCKPDNQLDYKSHQLHV